MGRGKGIADWSLMGRDMARSWADFSGVRSADSALEPHRSLLLATTSMFVFTWRIQREAERITYAYLGT